MGLERRYVDTLRIYTLASIFNPPVNKLTDFRGCSSIFPNCDVALQGGNVTNSGEICLLVVI